MQASSTAVNGVYEFGPFRLDPQRRVLLRHGEPVALTPKAFDILVVLVRKSGQPVTRDELMKTVWPDSFVEEGNLTQNISVLRKALGEHSYILTIPGRGYQFAEKVREVEDTPDALTVETPAHSRMVIAEREPPSRLLWVTAGMALLVVVAFLGLRLHRGKSLNQSVFSQPALAAASMRPSVAVLGFRNLSARPGDEWLSTAFAEMLNTELAAGNQLRLVSGEDVARARLETKLPEADTLAKPSLQHLHDELGADLIVLGSYTALPKKTGKEIRFDLWLQDARTGETIASQSATGTQDDLFQLVSQVGTGLRRKLGIARLSDTDTVQVHATVAANPHAARYYAQGLDRLRRFDALGARDLLEKAIAADPRHALSHSALAEALFDLGYDSKAAEEAKKALDLSASLPRADHLLIEGRYREFTHNYVGAIEIYQALRDFFPDQLDYGLYLANAQLKADHNKDALATVARLRELPEPQRSDPRIDLMQANLGDALGDFKLTQRMGEAAAAKAQRQGSRLLLAQAIERQGWALEELGEYGEANRLLAQARAVFAASGNPRASALVLLDMGDLAYDSGDLRHAQQIYNQALAEFRRTGAQQKAAVVLSRLGSVATDQGDLPAGKRYEEEALRLDREIGSGTARDMANLASVLVAMGDLSTAAEMNEQSARGFDQGGDKSNEAIVLADLAHLRLEQGEIDAAAQAVSNSIQMLNGRGAKRNLGFALFASAEILLAQDQLDKARSVAEQDLALRRQLGDKANLPDVQRLLAEIALEQGRASEAESLAKAAAADFDQQKVSGLGAQAYACLSRALLRRRQLQAAQAAADRALLLSRRGGDMVAGFDAALAQAAVAATAGRTVEAERTLQSMFRLASRHGYLGYVLQAQLRLAQLEWKSDPKAGRDQLTRLQREADAKGFRLIARRARAAMQGNISAI